jgi:hypothetical protein
VVARGPLLDSAPPDFTGVEGCRHESEGGWRYHLKVVNRTRHSVAEFSIDAVVVIPGLNPEIPDVEFRYRIPLAPGPVYPYLDAKECVIVGLRVNDLEGRLERLPNGLRGRLSTREVTLEELLSLRPDASLRIAIRAAHHLSGNKRTYALRYGEADIRQGVFRERLGVEIVPVGALAPDPSGG